MSISNLLKLDFFKSLGFNSKENGMEFIKAIPELENQIILQVDLNEDFKSNLLEDIKIIFTKFDDKKNTFIMKFKNEKVDKLANKKEILKKTLKEEMKSELLQEIKNEQILESNNKLKEKYSKCIPVIEDFDLKKLQDSFYNVINKIEKKEIEIDEIVLIEKAKLQVEKAMEVLIKAQKLLNSY